ncbi:MAG: chaperone NapD [Rhodospirillaceae bacterium]|jgi:periplasmic nitrate reductase NapD|nr:chaperone NapD [Rhodospirillaceae bacterium]MBT6137819.1 chaperone NapD [Rhodospirillaceae bacterium]
MSGDLHVSSLLVQASPTEIPMIASAIAKFSGAEVLPVKEGETGKLIVTLETTGESEIMDNLQAIHAMRGVMTASLVYHQVETDYADE